MRKIKDQTRNTKHHYDFQSEIQNPQSEIEFLAPDPPAAEHLKPESVSLHVMEIHPDNRSQFNILFFSLMRQFVVSGV